MQNFPSIKKHSDFKTVYQTGDSKATPVIAVYKMKNDLDHNRIGISASRKVGNSVVRHTFARKIREIFRLNNNQTVQGYDIVVVARNPAGKADYHRIEKDYLKLLSYHGILKELS